MIPRAKLTARAASPAREVPATPGSLLAATHPAVAREIALHAGLERSERTGGVVESHLLSARRSVCRRVFPVELGSAGDVVDALLEAWRSRIDRPEGGHGVAHDALQAAEPTRRRRTLQLGIRARVA